MASCLQAPPAKPLRLAIYYPWLYLKSGGERTIFELVSRSRHDWTIITNRYDADATYPELRDAKIIELQKVPVRRNLLQVAKAGYRILTQKLPLAGYQAALVFCEGLGDLVLFRNHTVPTACYCFTPLRVTFDPHYRQKYLAMTGASWAKRAVLAGLNTTFRVVDRQAWKRYDHVFVISREVEKRVHKGKLCDPHRMSILYAGIDTRKLQPSGQFSPFFFHPGRIMWTKNTELGIRSFNEFKKRRPDLSHFGLVVAGFVDEKSKPYLAKLQRMVNGRNDIRLVTNPTDRDMREFYQTCYSVLYTPFNEDMGLIPLEAMASGKPVFAVDRGGPRELIEHGRTGFLLEPEPEMFADAMEWVADNSYLVRAMGQAGVSHARQYDWSTFHTVIDNYFDQLVSRLRPGQKE